MQTKIRVKSKLFIFSFFFFFIESLPTQNGWVIPVQQLYNSDAHRTSTDMSFSDSNLFTLFSIHSISNPPEVENTS